MDSKQRISKSIKMMMEATAKKTQDKKHPLANELKGLKAMFASPGYPMKGVIQDVVFSKTSNGKEIVIVKIKDNRGESQEQWLTPKAMKVFEKYGVVFFSAPGSGGDAHLMVPEYEEFDYDEDEDNDHLQA